MTDRKQWVLEQLQKVDGAKGQPPQFKHQKMASSPLLFYRGSALLFYADLHQQHWQLPQALFNLPLTTIDHHCRRLSCVKFWFCH